MLLLLLLASSPACRLPDVQAPFPFRPGETLEYDLGIVPDPTQAVPPQLRGFRAGRMTLRVLAADRFQAEGKASSLASKVMRASGTATSIVDPRTLAPVRVNGVALAEGHEPIRIQQSFGEALEPREGYETLTFAPDTLDLLGTLYRLRAIALTPGAALCAQVSGVHGRWRFTAKVGEVETLSTRYAELPAVKVSGEAIDPAHPMVSGSFEAWYSTDARRLPLLFVGRGGIATLRAELTSVEAPGEPRRRDRDTWP